MGTVKLYRTRYLAEDIFEGDVPRDDVTEEEYDELSAREAANLIRREGLTFEATGSDWAANPDGSRTIDYAAGREEETSAHLEGFHPRVVAAIMAAVDQA